MKNSILAIAFLVSILSYGQTNISANNIKATGNISATGTVTGSNIPVSIPGAGICVNQFVRVLNNGLPPTCATVGSADLATSLALVTPSIGVAAGVSLNLSGNEVVSGIGNFSNLESILFTDQYGNGSTTGITGAITAAGTVNKTNIWVPSSYPTTEFVPGSIPQWAFTGPGSLAPQGGNNAANITFQDNRFGRYFTALDPQGDAAIINPNVQEWFRWNVNYIAGPSGQPFNNRDALSMNVNALDGGFNFNNNGYSNKENYAVIDSRLTAQTSGQHVGIQSFNTNYSVGDMLNFFGQEACYGGFTANGDEGCEAFDLEAYHGNVEFTATIASLGATGATSLNLTPTTGTGTQGAYRFLIDITKVTNAGTISAITFTNTSTPVAITGSGTSFGTSTVNTTLGTAVTTPGVTTVTPAAMTNISIGTLLCIADQFQFEHVKPTATTGTTFTAAFRYAHTNTAVVAAGGACGNYIELVADRATTAIFGSTSNINTGGNVGNSGQVVNTLHYIIPMIRSTSNTAADIWLSNPNAGYAPYRGRWTSSGTNTYAIYPGAQVVSVQGATSGCVGSSTCGTGNIGNPIVLEPNNATWANSDTVAEPLYFVQNVTLGQMIFQNFFPQAGAAQLGSLNIVANGINQAGDSFIGVTNNSPATLYTAGGGVLTPPYLMTTIGTFDQVIRLNNRPTTALILNLDNAGQTTIYRNLNGGGTQNDIFGFVPASGEYIFGTTGGGTFAAVNAESGYVRMKEVSAPGGSAGSDLCYGDSTAHALKCSYNNGTFFQQTQTVASGTAAMTTAAIASGACGTTVTVAATGVATTDVINVTRNAAATNANGGNMNLNAWPTSGNVNFNYCNQSAGSVTPTAMTVNWSVTR